MRVHVDRAAVDGVNEAPVDEELGLHESSSVYGVKRKRKPTRRSERDRIRREPLSQRCGRFGVAFSQTSSIDRFVE